MILFVPYTVNLLMAKRTTNPEELEEAMEDAMIQLELMGHLFGRKIEIRAGIQWLVFASCGRSWGRSSLSGAYCVLRAISRSTRAGRYLDSRGGHDLARHRGLVPCSEARVRDLALGEGIGANIVTMLLTLGLMAW